MKKPTFEDRIKELEEDTKVLKEQINILGRRLFMHDEDFKNLNKRINHLEYDIKHHKHDGDALLLPLFDSIKLEEEGK